MVVPSRSWKPFSSKIEGDSLSWNRRPQPYRKTRVSSGEREFTRPRASWSSESVFLVARLSVWMQSVNGVSWQEDRTYGLKSEKKRGSNLFFEFFRSLKSNLARGITRYKFDEIGQARFHNVRTTR